MSGIAHGKGRDEREERFRFSALAHPLRRRIMRLMLDGREMTAPALATALSSMRGTVSYHLRVLRRRRALEASARGPTLPPLYRLAPDADWVRKMLSEGGEFGDQDP